jgi:hypothetical protein
LVLELRPGDEPADGCSDDVTVLNVSDYDPPRLTSKTWRQLIHKVWEVDPLVCPRCGAEMKIIVLIDDPAVIRRISLPTWGRRDRRRGTKPANLPAGFKFNSSEFGPRGTEGRQGIVGAVATTPWSFKNVGFR